MSEKTRIKRTVDFEAGTIQYSQGDVKHVVNVTKDTGLKVNGMAQSLVTAALLAKLVEFCAGGDIVATKTRMDEAIKAIKAGSIVPLMAWDEQKLVYAMQALMQAKGHSAATLADAYSKIKIAQTKPGVPKKVGGETVERTAWETIQDSDEFRNLIPKKEAPAAKPLAADLLKSLDI